MVREEERQKALGSAGLMRRAGGAEGDAEAETTGGPENGSGELGGTNAVTEDGHVPSGADPDGSGQERGGEEEDEEEDGVGGTSNLEWGGIEGPRKSRFLGGVLSQMVRHPIPLQGECVEPERLTRADAQLVCFCICT